nr:ATP-binding protein [Litoreibacter janthinus]
MNQLVETRSVLDRARAGLAARQWLPMTLAIALALAFLLIPDVRVFAGVAFASVFVAIGILLKHQAISAGASDASSFEDFIAHDDMAVFVTDPSGFILSRNVAALDLFSSPEGDALEQVLGQLMGNANAIVFRLQAKAQKADSAHEHVVTRRGNFDISTYRVANSENLVWRINGQPDQPGAGHAADRLSLPMFTTGGSGTVLFMNEAMRKLTGERPKSLSAIFPTIPDSSGQQSVVSGVDGPVDVMVIIVDAVLGRTEYFLAPVTETERPANIMAQLEDFPIALLELDPTGRIKDSNRIARSLLFLGEDPADNMSDLIEGLGRPLSAWLSEAAEGKGLHRTEVLKCRRGPDEMYVQVTLGRAISDGEVSIIVLVNDATELKSLEEQFVQSQKMQAIGQLAGGVAHDFNNLLTAISGHCDLLMLRHDPGDNDFADLEQINQNANRAASLVGQLLAFSRKQNLQLEVLDMRDTLSDLTHLLNRLVGAQISLTLTHDPNLMSVRADRRQLEQVLMNLVVNARDALSGHGQIGIETRNVKLNSELRRDRAVVPAGDYVLVKVSDDGCGIPAEKLPKISSHFSRPRKPAMELDSDCPLHMGLSSNLVDLFLLIANWVREQSSRSIFPHMTNQL